MEESFQKSEEFKQNLIRICRFSGYNLPLPSSGKQLILYCGGNWFHAWRYRYTKWIANSMEHRTSLILIHLSLLVQFPTCWTKGCLWKGKANVCFLRGDRRANGKGKGPTNRAWQTAASWLSPLWQGVLSFYLPN